MSQSESITAPEIWKPVVSWEGIYEVSTSGRIRRLLSSPNTQVGKILKPATDAGYQRVCLKQKPRVQSIRVHRVVAFAFLGSPPSASHEVNHKDGDKSNNTLRNLEYVTPLENVRHAERHGLSRHPSGEDAPSTRISDKDVLHIHALVHRGVDTSEIAATFGISRSYVYGIKYHRRRRYLWDHIDAPSLRD